MRKIILAALFLLPVLFLVPHLDQIPFQPGGVYSDLLVSHYPNAIYLQRALLEWKTIPLWSDTILSGYPFSANPLAGLYYLPGWLALLFPLPLGFNLTVLIHLILAGLGMFCLLRSEGLPETAALFGALAFEALPKLSSHLGAGHFTLIYAVTWTPWLLYAERRVAAPKRLRWILPGMLLGVIALADVRWAAYAGLLWLAYSLRLALAILPAENRLRAFWSGWAATRLVNIVFAGLVAAPLLLPLAEYTRLSTRSLLTAQDNLTLSLPPGQLLSLIYPTIAGAAEWMLYPGAVVFCLTLYTLSTRSVRRQTGFWLGLIGITLVVALGSYLPPLQILARLPGLDLLRVPPRVLFLTGIGFAVVAGFAFHSLHTRLLAEVRPAVGRAGLVLFGVTAFVVLLALAVWVMVDRPLPRIQFAWGAVFLLAAAVLILLALNKRVPLSVLTVGLLSLSLIDLLGVNGLSLEFRPSARVFAQGQVLADFLVSKGGQAPFRVYSPSYSLPQHLAARNSLELADGVDPLQLAAYVRYMEDATGVPGQGYSVTLPSYKDDPAVDNASYRPDAARLGLLNVKYIVSDFPLSVDGLIPLAQFSQTHVYDNTLVLPRAWVQSPDAPPGQKILSTPSLTERPNSLVLSAKGPGLLVLSEMAYPGWQAAVDGKPVKVETVGGLLRGIRLDAGNHQVIFTFRPVSLYIGLVLAVVAWSIFAIQITTIRRTADA